MPGPKLPLTNFTKGEFAPELYARVDVPQYGAGAKRLRNWIILRQGGVVFRPGFRFVGEADTVDEEERMIPFFYRQDAAYMQVFSDYRLRLLAQGGYVVEDDLEIQSVTYGATTTIEVPFHDYAIGDRVYFDGNTGPESLNGSYGTVTAVPDADHVTFDIDTTGEDALTASTGITRTEAPDAPPAPPDPLDPPAEPDDPPDTTDPGDDLGGGSGGGIPWWKLDDEGIE